jgi:hypothetical protein
MVCEDGVEIFDMAQPHEAMITAQARKRRVPDAVISVVIVKVDEIAAMREP